MKYGSLAVYFNEDFGYIVVPYTKMKGSALNLTMKQVYVKEKGIADEEMGIVIKKAIQESCDALPIERSELDGYNFWEVSGIKGYATFSKKFRNIGITNRENCYELTLYRREKERSYYVPDMDCKPEQLPLTVSEKQLGKTVKQMVSGKASSEDDSILSFQTLNENTVSYTRPGDDFEDMGDGHTDAYQIFAHEKYNKNYIAFLIDNKYSEINEEGIKSRWKQIYGEVFEYHYEEIRDEQLKIVVTAKTKEVELFSHFYRDGEDLLEVLVEIDLVDTPKKLQGEINMGLKKVIDSIEIV